MDEKGLGQFQDRIKELRKQVRKLTTATVHKQTLRDEASQIGTLWFAEVSAALQGTIDSVVLDSYSKSFERLIRISAPSNRRQSYEDVLTDILRRFRQDLVMPLATREKGGGAGESHFDEIFASISDQAESDYLQEAVNCAKAKYLRAAAVLGWSACIDRIHRKIEEIGFAKFNVKSAEMASQQKGRYKKFNQTLNVGSLSEIREVPDGVILWVLEGLGLIDVNQQTRLRSCLDIRIHSAHPGEAPITRYNLMSFFSDIQQIVLASPKFQLGDKS